MKIALINENSQAAKNEMICDNLKKVVEPMGHTVYNYGMYTAEDETQLTYVMNGLLAAILLNSKAADYVVTGCGTGEGFGWGAELRLQYIFEKLFGCESGGGYPKERVVPEQRNKKILDGVKEITHKDIMTILKTIDQDFLKTAISGEKFQEYFFPNCQVPEIAEYLKSVLA